MSTTTAAARPPEAGICRSTEAPISYTESMQTPLPTGLLTVALLLGSPAAAKPEASPLPVLPDRDGVTRLRPEAPEAKPLPAPLQITEPVEEAPVSERIGGFALTTHARVVGIPDFVVDAFMKDHTSYVYAATGLSLDIGHPRDGQWVVELDWTGVRFAPGNWRPPKTPTYGAAYLDIDLHLISVDVTYRGHVFINEWLSWTFGAGLGIAGLVGKIESIEVVPSCEEPVASCQHWRKVGRQRLKLPTPVLPIVHLMTGLAVTIDDGFVGRLELGIRDVPYVGLSLGFRL